MREEKMAFTKLDATLLLGAALLCSQFAFTSNFTPNFLDARSASILKMQELASGREARDIKIEKSWRLGNTNYFLVSGSSSMLPKKRNDGSILISSETYYTYDFLIRLNCLNYNSNCNAFEKVDVTGREELAPIL
jgi:hypothetical protein